MIIKMEAAASQPRYWSEDEDNELRVEAHHNLTIGQMAARHERTTRAIWMRLAKQAGLSNPQLTPGGPGWQLEDMTWNEAWQSYERTREEFRVNGVKEPRQRQKQRNTPNRW